MALPKDPVMLLSYVNTKLRDEYDSLEELCKVLDEDKEALTDKLGEINYSYDAVKNQFV